MKKLILYSITLLTTALFSQEVNVLDADTKEPLESVLIYNSQKGTSVYTNRKGLAKIILFEAEDSLTFSHLQYNKVVFQKSALPSTVFLVKSVEYLEDIVLSASKGSEKSSRIAKQVVTANRAKIKKINPQTSADLLANLPSIKVQKSQFGGGSPVLRGMEANRVLLVIDGVRMNNAIYRSGHLQSSITVSPNSLERAEVLFGPSSVIYGSDALGGVIHYYTKTPKISNEKTKVKTSLFSRYSTVNSEFLGEGSIEINTKKWGSYTSFSYAVYGDLTMGKVRSHGFDNWGRITEYSSNSDTYYTLNSTQNSDSNIQRNVGYHQIDFLEKLFIPISEKSRLTFNIQYSTSSNIPRFDKLTEYSEGRLKFAEWYYGPQKRFLASSQIKIRPEKGWMEKGTITLAYQNIEESRVQRKFSSLERFYRTENVSVYSINGDFNVFLTPEKNRTLSYGFEGVYNKVDSTPEGKLLEVTGSNIIGYQGSFNVQSRYPDGGSSYANHAVYINYRQDVTDKMTLNSGIRYTGTYLAAQWDDKSFITLPNYDIKLNNDAITATLGYTYRPTRNWQLNTVLSSGFRSPNIDDVGKIREKSGKVTVPNIHLKPEYAYNTEFSLQRYFNDKKIKLETVFHYTLLNNYITRDFSSIGGASEIKYDGVLGKVIANVNKGNAYIFGSSMSLHGKLSNLFTTSASITYTKGETYDTLLPLSSIPPLFGFISLGVEKDKLSLDAVWRFNGAKKREDYNPIDGVDNIEQSPYDELSGTYLGTPKWNTLGFRANYTFSDRIKAYLNIDNILDTHYKEFASSISAPGRNFSLALQVNL